MRRFLPLLLSLSIVATAVPASAGTGNVNGIDGEPIVPPSEVGRWWSASESAGDVERIDPTTGESTPAELDEYIDIVETRLRYDRQSVLSISLVFVFLTSTWDEVDLFVTSGDVDGGNYLVTAARGGQVVVRSSDGTGLCAAAFAPSKIGKIRLKIPSRCIGAPASIKQLDVTALDVREDADTTVGWYVDRMSVGEVPSRT